MGTVTEQAAPSTESEATHVRALCQMSLAQPQSARDGQWYSRMKRACDVAMAGLALLFLSPGLLAIAIAIKATSPGPAILVQERVGKGGRIFPFYKFRSMYYDLDHSGDVQFAREYVNGNPKPGPAWDGVFKPANDRRITPVGRLLRKGSLDELPQLLNVLKGDMSLVGPRPSMPYEVDVYQDWHFRRLEVLPGLTGLAQVRGRSSLTFQDIVKIDIEYIEHRSLWLDVQILCKTLPVVFSGHGAR